ncbi:transposase [Cetobacterium somerae]|uniref:Mu transposase C-terminal domain-containing protein n=1 Tax=Cetobacterium somerae TaxID=188913 RepID=UPI00211E1586|nr:Mu transposase C-terminal domain-containing protein [Cetobacterium somerae]MCQ9626884.1 transposase [Cetobacterium somerae]
MEKYYDIEEFAKLLGKSRTVALRLANKESFTVEKVKNGRTFKNMYLKTEIDKYLNIGAITPTTLTRTVAKQEVNSVDELPEWNQRIAWARYVICLKLREAYESDGKKGDIIEEFVKDLPENFPKQFEIIKKISVPTLRRWYSSFLKDSENPLVLATDLGAKKGLRNIPEEALVDIRTLYKSRNKPSMMFVYERIIAKYGNIVTYATLRNYLTNDLNVIEKAQGRMGDKEFRDKHSIYTKRDYTVLRVNEYWVSDGHDLELMCYRKGMKNAKGERILSSPKMMVWMDVRTRFVVGWTLAWTETTESIAIALKRGIEKYGVPEKVYTDNGKAYKSKVLKGTDELDGIYESLGIAVTHTLPYSGQSKHIERWFRVFKENFAKGSITYKGGNIIERPERLGSFAVEKIDKGMILEEDELITAIESWLEYANHGYYKLRGGHRGQGMEGKTPKELYYEYLDKEDRKVLSDEKLRLLFMYEDIRVITRNGINYFGQTYSHEDLYFRQGEKVKIKYDPHDLKIILVYALSGEYICKAERLSEFGFNDVEGIKSKKRREKDIRKLSKQLIGLREQEREENGLLEYQEHFRRKENNLECIDYKEAVETSNKAKEVSIGDGLVLEID